ncbi:MAG: transglutaminase domain-containing protein [bacterium]
MNFLNYYTEHGKFTDPHGFIYLFDQLPDKIEELVSIIQGVLLLDVDIGTLGYSPPIDRWKEVELRYVSKMLRKILELDNKPLFENRKVNKKLIVTCRDFKVLLCSILRHKKIPARVRFGFHKHHYIYCDSTALEYWRAEENRWCVVDFVRTAENIYVQCRLRLRW